MINLSDCKRIHCIGIGGIGMSAIAEILLERGFQVSGSDMKESEMVDKLIARGAEVYLGHRAKNVGSFGRQSRNSQGRRAWHTRSYKGADARQTDE